MNQCQRQHPTQPLREIMASTRLPVLPPNTPYLLRAMASEEITFRELAAVVEKFPTIAAKLIALANSPWSAPVVEVTSVEMACSRLGFSVVRSVSVALGIANAFNPALCPAFDPVRYWTGAFLMAELTTRLAESAADDHEVEPQSVRTAGLLHNLGLLWLATCMPDETHQALLSAEGEAAGSLDGLLHELCGIGFVEAGALLAESWEFPDMLVESLRHQDDPGYREQYWQSAALLGVAKELLHENAEPTGQPPDPRWSQLGFSPEQQEEFRKLAGERRSDVQELARTLFAG